MEEPNLEGLLDILKTAGYSERLVNIVEKINNAAKSIEKTILDGAELNIKEERDKIYLDIVQYFSEAKSETRETLCSETSMIEWSIKKLEETGVNAKKQRKLFEFYEKTPDKQDYMMWNNPEKPRAKAFIKEGDEFYIRTIKFPNLNISECEKSSFMVAEGYAEIVIHEREPWTRDYRKLLNKIQEEGQDYSVMLVHYPKAIPDDKKEMGHMAGIFLGMFANYRESQRKDI